MINTFAHAGLASQPATSQPAVLELDGSRVRVLATALPAFAEKAPDARLDDYHVHVHPEKDGVAQVVFEPRQPEGAPPTLGGSTAAGPEVNVWVRVADNAVDRVSLAR